MADRQRGELFAPAREECIGADHEPARSQLDQLCEDSIEVTFGAGIQDMELQPEGTSRRLHLLRVVSATVGLAGLTSRAMTLAVGTSSCSNCSRFGVISTFVWVTPVTLPPGRLRLADEAEPDRVAARFEDDRNGRGRRLCRKRRRSAGRGNHGHLTMNQISRHRRQPIILALRPAVFDRHVLAFDVTGFAQPFEKGGQLSRITLGRSDVDKPNHRHRRLLRTRRERPVNCRSPPRSVMKSRRCMCPREDHALCNG